MWAIYHECWGCALPRSVKRPQCSGLHEIKLREKEIWKIFSLPSSGIASECSTIHSTPSISMREALSAFMSEWSTVERSGQHGEIKRVADFQIYFFSLWSYTFSCLNHCGSAKWSLGKSPLFEAFLMASCFEQTHVARLKNLAHSLFTQFSSLTWHSSDWRTYHYNDFYASWNVIEFVPIFIRKNFFFFFYHSGIKEIQKKNNLHLHSCSK